MEFSEYSKSGPSRNNHYNYPFPKKSNTMTLQTLNKQTDGVNPKAVAFETKRNSTYNLLAHDIKGK